MTRLMSPSMTRSRRCLEGRLGYGCSLSAQSLGKPFRGTAWGRTLSDLTTSGGAAISTGCNGCLCSLIHAVGMQRIRFHGIARPQTELRFYGLANALSEKPCVDVLGTNGVEPVAAYPQLRTGQQRPGPWSWLSLCDSDSQLVTRAFDTRRSAFSVVYGCSQQPTAPQVGAMQSVSWLPPKMKTSEQFAGRNLAKHHRSI